MRDIIFVRTHFFDAALEAFYWQLVETSRRPVALICDETRSSVEVPKGISCISINRDYVAAMGLHAPEDFGWLCGDYFIYAGQRSFPRFDRYWLIESDVRMKMQDTSVFFNSFANIDADFMAFHMFKANPAWYWHSPMCHFSQEVHSCIFPVTATSRRAAEHLLRKRLEMSTTYDAIVPKEEPRRWPNDESFVASTLQRDGFTSQSLNGTGVRFSTEKTFGVGLAKSSVRVGGLPDDEQLYHPVHSGERFVKKAHDWLGNYLHNNASPAVLSAVFDEAFVRDIAAEGGEAEAERFQARLAQALAKLAGPAAPDDAAAASELSCT